MSFLDAKVCFAVFKDFSLVIKLHNIFQLLAIRHICWIQPLIHVLLANGYVMLQINEMILIEEVVHLLIHSFDHMVSYDITFIRNSLNLSLFYILIEVPHQNGNDIFLMVLCDNLQYILLDCLNQTNYLRVGRKVACQVCEVFALLLFKGVL